MPQTYSTKQDHIIATFSPWDVGRDRFIFSCFTISIGSKTRIREHVFSCGARFALSGLRGCDREVGGRKSFDVLSRYLEMVEYVESDWATRFCPSEISLEEGTNATEELSSSPALSR